MPKKELVIFAYFLSNNCHDETSLSEMKHLNVLAISAIVVVLAMTATAEAGSIPNWIKNVAGFWSDDQISDSEFLDAIQFLVDEKIIKVKPVYVDKIIEVQAETMPTDTGPIWESIGALQEEDEKLRWEIYNNMIGATAYDEYGDFIGENGQRIIQLEADVHDLKLQLDCLIESEKESRQADCTREGMTKWR